MLPDKPKFFVSPYSPTKLAPSLPLPPIKSPMFLNVKSRYMLHPKEPSDKSAALNYGPKWKKINGS
jgi:hypothetical protein